MTFPTTPVLDSFDRADGALGANWSLLNDAGVLAVIDDLSAVPDAAYSSAYWNPTTFGPDCECWVRYANDAGAFSSVFARAKDLPSAATLDGYIVAVNGDGAGTVTIRRYDNGAGTILATNAATDILAGHKVGIQCIGSTIKAWVDIGSGWVELLSVTDATYGAAGRIGFDTINDATAIGDFGGGTVATNNLVINPSFIIDATQDWSTYQTSLERDTGVFRGVVPGDIASLKVTRTAGSDYSTVYDLYITGPTIGRLYRAGAWLYVPPASQVIGKPLLFMVGESGGADGGLWTNGGTYTIVSGWQRLENSRSLTSNDRTQVRLQVYVIGSGAAGDIFWVDDVEIYDLTSGPAGIFGPSLLAASAATIYTVPAVTKTVIRSIRASNPGGGPSNAAVLDDFNRANSDLTPTANWNAIQAGSLSVVSNQVGAGSGTSDARWLGSSFAADQEAWVTVPVKPGGDGEIAGVYCRVNPSANSGYMFILLDRAGTDDYKFWSWVAGTPTQIGSTVSGPEFVAGDRLGFTVIGNVLTGYVFTGGVWVQVMQATDSTHTGAGHIGLTLSQTTGRLDNFGGGAAGAGTNRQVTVSIGADAAATRIIGGEIVAAGTQRRWKGPWTLEAGEILQAFAGTFPTNNTLLDDFNRGDEGPPMTGWDAGTGAHVVSSNRCVGGGAGENLSRTESVYAADQEAWATVAVKGATFGQGGVGVRMAAGPNGYIFFYSDQAGTDQYRLYRYDTGALTQLGSSVVGPELVAGDKVGLSAIGSVLTGYLYQGGSWTQIIQQTDSTYATGKLGIFTLDADVAMDDFGGGDIVAAVELTIDANVYVLGM